MAGKVTQQSPVLKKWSIQVQATEAEAVVEEETITNDVEDEVGTPTVQHKRHKLESSREK